MRKNACKFFYGALAIALMVIVTNQYTVAQTITNGQKVKLKGLIIGRTGDNLTMRTTEGGNVVANITDNTKVEAKKGKLGIRKESQAVTALMPGLKIEVEGLGNERGEVVATDIKFSMDDLQQAQAIQAGLNPTKQQLQATDAQVQANQQAIQANKKGIQANKQQTRATQQATQANQQAIQAEQQQLAQVSSEEADLHKRFSELTEYDVKYTVTIYFPSNSSALSAKAKQDLSDLATNASGLKGFMIQVAGYASTTGNAEANQRLSAQRSQNVVNYLAQTGKIQLRHILAPAAMGTSQAVASNDTPEGRALNRRVEVKVLVNKGISGN